MKSDQENPVKKTKTASRQKSVSGKAVVNSKDPGEGVVLLVPMIPLRGLTVFPGINLTFDVAREKSKEAVKAAMEGNQLVFLTAQLDPTQDWPPSDQVYQVGCVARIRQILEIPGSESVKLLGEGRNRGDWLSRQRRTLLFDRSECFRHGIPERSRTDSRGLSTPVNEGIRKIRRQQQPRFSGNPDLLGRNQQRVHGGGRHCRPVEHQNDGKTDVA